MWDTNLNALSLQRASEEETLNYLQNKINGLKQKVDLAKQNPESVSDRLNVYVQGLGIKFSDNPEERRKELKLMACIEARKQFRLQEIHDSLASAQSLDERLKSKEMHYIPQTDVYAIMEVGEPDCFVSAPIAIYDISDKRLGESKIASFVKGLYPKLFGENKKSASYVAYAVPKECLDMVEEVVTVKSGPPRKEKLKPLLNIIDV
jgi:hypothetical protein